MLGSIYTELSVAAQIDIHKLADLVRSEVGLCNHLVSLLDKHKSEEPEHIQHKLTGMWPTVTWCSSLRINRYM